MDTFYLQSVSHTYLAVKSCNSIWADALVGTYLVLARSTIFARVTSFAFINIWKCTYLLFRYQSVTGRLLLLRQKKSLPWKEAFLVTTKSCLHTLIPKSLVYRKLSSGRGAGSKIVKGDALVGNSANLHLVSYLPPHPFSLIWKPTTLERWDIRLNCVHSWQENVAQSRSWCFISAQISTVFKTNYNRACDGILESH